MKFFGIVVALISALSVFAGPPPAKYTTDNKFEYYLISGTATVIRVLNNNLRTLTINPYVYYEGERYIVTSINQGLDESKVETLIIPESVQHRFFLSSAISSAKNLRTIQINAPDVTAGSNTFSDVKRTINLKGKGLEKMALNYAMDILTSINEKPTTYTSSTSAYQKEQHLYALARNLKNNGYLNYSSNLSNASNGLHTLFYGEGNMLGLARAFRVYALAKGFSAADIKVAGDNKYYDWNNIRLDNNWYNFDVVHTTFKNGQGDVSVFYTDNDYNNKILKPFYGTGVSPSTWIIYLAEYGYPNEVSGSQTQNRDTWINNNRWNGVYHGHK